jgi:hypothetical protein
MSGVTSVNPFNNRWAAVFLVVAVMLGVSELVGSDGGVLSQAANYGAGNSEAPLPEGVVQVTDTVAPAPAVTPEEEPEEDLSLDDDTASTDEDDGVVEVIDEPADDEGGGPVLVTEEQTEEQEE